MAVGYLSICHSYDSSCVLDLHLNQRSHAAFIYRDERQL